jgi:hypothetical protein
VIKPEFALIARPSGSCGFIENVVAAPPALTGWFGSMAMLRKYTTLFELYENSLDSFSDGVFPGALVASGFLDNVEPVGASVDGDDSVQANIENEIVTTARMNPNLSCPNFNNISPPHFKRQK